MRLDAWLITKELFPSREQAKRAIELGMIYCNGHPIRRPAYGVKSDDFIEVKGNPCPYVSRGGLKLEKAIRDFQLSLESLRIIDIGASTGGFTDCALQHGAAKVYAVDVGSGQLAETLRNHPRVIAYENLDARHLTLDHLEGQPADMLVCDVSFISLVHLLPNFPGLLGKDALMVLLIKPQFEQEHRIPLKGGIVKDPLMMEKAIQRIKNCALTLGFEWLALTETDEDPFMRRNKEFPVLLKNSQPYKVS